MPPPHNSSGRWGRLRPVQQDPLDVYGLPSKGEMRLHDFKTQELYYTKIIERYLAFCTEADGRDGLLARFASFEQVKDKEKGAREAREAREKKDKDKDGSGASSGTPSPSSAAPSTPTSSSSGSSTATSAATAPSTPTSASSASSAASAASSAARRVKAAMTSTHGRMSTAAAAAATAKDLSDVLMALRKLREAIVATQRADDFAVHAYLFCIRLAILVRQPEAYHPAILYLLRVMRQHHPLTSVEAHEIMGYLVLDAACRRSDLAEAYRLRCFYRLRNPTVDAVLAALVHDDWVSFRRLQQHVDGHQAKLLECADGALRMHTLKCFGRAYLRLGDVAYLESSTAMAWSDLCSKCSVGWEREGDAVIIRKAKQQAGPPVPAKDAQPAQQSKPAKQGKPAKPAKPAKSAKPTSATLVT